MKKNKYHHSIVFFLLATVLMLSSCGKDNFEPVTKPTDQDTTTVDPPDDPTDPDVSKIYIPLEFRNMDFSKTSSTWCYSRSRQSEHFIVFWGAGYGANDPNSSAVASAYRVDIDDLLAKAEQFFELNINKLKFAELGTGKSNLDKYKMMIFLFYESEWRATGSGYDDVIGALWISPNTCQPVGSTIAHEIGHSFQYQTHCDLKGGAGFRYGYGGYSGNTFWEQTAQWQAYQSYPTEAFVSSNFSVYTSNYFRHLCHEEYRYASYFIHYYWADKHGIDFIGRLWREAQQPEDPFQAYMRINSLSVEQFNDEIYDQAARLVTWDIAAIRDNGRNYIGAQSCKMVAMNEAPAKYRPDVSFCLEPTGYNVIPLNVPATGTEVTADFAAAPNFSGYSVDYQMLGYRYGFVALKSDNSRVYGEMYKSDSGEAKFTVPAGCERLWFVVSGASPVYTPHAWDDNNANDIQLPYTVQFKNTNLLGSINFDGSETPMDTTLTFDISFPYDANAYSGINLKLDQTALAKLARAFVMQPDDIIANIAQSGKPIKLYAIENNGALNGNYTASSDGYVNIFGHYFTAEGNVCNWSDATSRIFSEFTPAQLSFTIGQYPGRCAAGSKYSIKQALVYTKDSKQYMATFVFNITIQ